MPRSPNGFGVATEDIVFSALPGLPFAPNASSTGTKNPLTEKVLVSLQLNYSLLGGTFSASILADELPPPLNESAFTVLNGRLGIVKQVGKSRSSAGLLDTISGPLVPLAALRVWAFALANTQSTVLSNIANSLGMSVAWQASDFFLKNFSFRGVALGGIQQLASVVLADVLINNGGVYVVPPGGLPSDSARFFVPNTDIVSVQQTIDYSPDISSILNPALTAINLIDPGNFMYDSEHAIKQGKSLVQCGSIGGTGTGGFIPIPDGWLVDGNFDEWPVSGTDLTNPSPSNPSTGQQYWKVFPSPTQPGIMRGVKNFTRLVRDMKLPGNVSSFVGSPITGQVGKAANTFNIQTASTESGIDGFTADFTVVPDIVTGQLIEVQKGLQLIPPGGNSGDPTSFYSVNLEFWTFPRVLPTVFPVGDPTNPFNIPKTVVIVNPNSNVLNGRSSGYWSVYLQNFKKLNSPRLKTSVSCIYRNILPQVGDSLSIYGFPDAGRINAVGLNMGRSGVVLNLQSEVLQAASGLWSNP